MKSISTILYTFLMLIFSIGLSYAQPVNDNCSNATTLTEGANCLHGTNVGATSPGTDPLPPCWLGTGPTNGTVWYRFTAPATGSYTFSTDNGIGAYNEDTQMALYSGSCASLNYVACSEDNGSHNTLAAQITANLFGGATYYLMVDVYGTSTGTFCINVLRNVAPVNDCVLNAIDLTPRIDGLTANFDCDAYVHNVPGGGASPTPDNISGGYNGCNGPYSSTQYVDTWFKFTVSASTPPVWLSLYPTAGSPNYGVQLFSGTPSGSCGGSITGLTGVDCSAGNITYVPPALPPNNQGGNRDKSKCTTPVRPRLDVSGLAPGDYYVRVWQIGNSNDDGLINICIEDTTHNPIISDRCPAAVTPPCPTPNQNFNGTYPNLSNAGMMGNACNTVSNEPQLATGVTTQASIGCTGSFLTYAQNYLNNVMNNSAIIPFTINAASPCNANVTIRFDNMVMQGTNGGVAQIQVMPAPCDGGTGAVMTFSTNASCLEMRPSSGTLPSGNYFIVVDGQDGQLINFDLTIDITHTGVGCTPGSPCVLGVEFIDVDGRDAGDQVDLNWEIQADESIDHFVIESSADGSSFTAIGEVRAGGAIESQHYKYVDPQPERGMNYYRIHAVTVNGETKSSDVVAVMHGGLTEGARIYPNPTERTLNAEMYISAGGQHHVMVLNSVGQVVFEEAYFLEQGMEVMQLDLAELNEGFYFLLVRDQQGKTIRKAFTIKR